MQSPPGMRVIGLSLGLLLLGDLLILSASGAGRALSPSSDGKPATSRKAAAFALNSLDGLDIHAVHQDGLNQAKVTYDVATYRGRRALHLVNDDRAIAKGNRSGGQSLAIVSGSELKDGSIEVDLVGLPRKGSPPDTRGFVGVAFHVRAKGDQFEAFYLRFTNGRAEEQIRRNHTTQYVSEPDYPWFRLREESPGVYESYVDVEPEAWTNLQIEVTGTKARLYVNHAAQPCLMVNDLKLGESQGFVALWDGADTEAYFSNLRIEPR